MTGVSTASFDVQPDGRVEARLVFASAEPLAGTPLREEDLRAFVLDGVGVSTDGAVCPATFLGAGQTEVDGSGNLVLEASYACPRVIGEVSGIDVTLYYLSALGPRRRGRSRESRPAVLQAKRCSRPTIGRSHSGCPGTPSAQDACKGGGCSHDRVGRVRRSRGGPLPGADVHRGLVTVRGQRLYSLVSSTGDQSHLLTLEIPPGVSAYDFTFG